MATNKPSTTSRKIKKPIESKSKAFKETSETGKHFLHKSVATKSAVSEFKKSFFSKQSISSDSSDASLAIVSSKEELQRENQLSDSRKELFDNIKKSLANETHSFDLPQEISDNVTQQSSQSLDAYNSNSFIDQQILDNLAKSKDNMKAIVETKQNSQTNDFLFWDTKVIPKTDAIETKDKFTSPINNETLVDKNPDEDAYDDKDILLSENKQQFLKKKSQSVDSSNKEEARKLSSAVMSHFLEFRKQSTDVKPLVRRSSISYNKRSYAAAPEDNIIINETTVAPAPSRDFYQLLVTYTDVIFRRWIISHNLTGKLGSTDIKFLHNDFLDDNTIQSHVRQIFGKNMLEYIKNILEGQLDYLPRLPDKLLIYILTFLSYKDLCTISMVNQHLYRTASQDFLWKKLFKINVSIDITKEIVRDTQGETWKNRFSYYKRKYISPQHGNREVTAAILNPVHRISANKEANP